MTQKAIFLDRDGTIIHDVGYMHELGHLKFLPGALEGLKEFQKDGYLLLILTNQSGVGRGLFKEEDAKNFNDFLLKKLDLEGITIPKTYFCFHKPEDNCNCRKPKKGMLLNALEDFEIDLSKSWVIGDNLKDIQLSEGTKLNSVYLSVPENNLEGVQPTLYASNLLDAYKKIQSFLINKKD